MNEAVCNECGNPLSSRVHLEGLNGIHDGPKQPLVMVVMAESAQPVEPFEGMTKAELTALVREKGLDIPQHATNDQLKALLRGV